jgi:TetR/AcrR family transcriptional regulator, tetracycline repressor protein
MARKGGILGTGGSMPILLGTVSDPSTRHEDNRRPPVADCYQRREKVFMGLPRDKPTIVDKAGSGALSEPTLDADWHGTLAKFACSLRSEYVPDRDGIHTFSGTRITDTEPPCAQESVLAQLTAAGFKLADAVDAMDLTTAFVVGFVTGEQVSEADPSLHFPAECGEQLGEGKPLLWTAGHLGDQRDERFERHLRILLAGLAAGLNR